VIHLHKNIVEAVFVRKGQCDESFNQIIGERSFTRDNEVL
jgi:hypothetical protein